MATKKQTAPPKKTARTASPKPAKAPPAEAAPALTFQKGAFYEDARGNLWHCANAKPKRTPDGHTVVRMRKTEDGQPVGEPGEEYADTFTKQLTKAELAEYRDACRREQEALADATGATPAAEPPTETPPVDVSAAAPTPVTKPRAKREGRLSCLDAAALVLAEATAPMSALEMIEAMATRGLWTSPGGATPSATLYAAIIREVAKKGAESRFRKTDRGRFTAASASVVKADDELPADGSPGPKSVSDLFKL